MESCLEYISPFHRWGSLNAMRRVPANGIGVSWSKVTAKPRQEYRCRHNDCLDSCKLQEQEGQGEIAPRSSINPISTSLCSTLFSLPRSLCCGVQFRSTLGQGSLMTLRWSSRARSQNT